MTIPRLAPLMSISLAVFGAGVMVLALVMLPSWISVSPPEHYTRTPDLSGAQINYEALANYDIITARPLFNIGRLPDPLPQPPKPVLPSADSFRLVGLVVSPDVKVALVIRQRDGQSLRLKTGDMLDGWTVQDVTVDGVKLSAQDQSTELKIPKAALSHQSAAAGVSPPSPAMASGNQTIAQPVSTNGAPTRD